MYIIADKTKNINKSKELSAYQLSEQMGFHLIPLQAGGKEPEFDLLLGNSTKPYQKDRAGAELVKSWFNSDQDLNIGVFGGTKLDDQYSLIIIDLDKKPDFGLPITPIVETSRGYHLYFKCLTNKLPKPHKSPRGEIKVNGYVVAPPSKHPSGKAYKWAEYLSYNDVPLADFDDRRDQIIKFLDGKGKTKKKSDPETKSETYVSRIKGDSKKKIHIKQGSNKELLIELSKDESVAKRIMKNIFNINMRRVGSSFKCPLHKEKKPSAALYRTDNGVIGFKDFHRAGAFYTLPELYYEYLTGKQKSLKSGTALIWWIRLLRNAGVIEVPRIIVNKDLDQLSDKQRVLFEGFVELLEVQQAYNTEQDSAPFSHRFAAEWTGLNYETVRTAKVGLIKKDFIIKVEAGDRKTMTAGKWAIKKD
jgi:hypothetical protein